MNTDKIAEVTVTFQEIAEVHRQLAEIHTSAQRMMLEAASLLSCGEGPHDSLFVSAQSAQREFTYLREELSRLLELADQQVSECGL